jgi:hypothetical protein
VSRSIVELADIFFRRSFSVETAHQLFGPPSLHTAPNTIRIDPREPGFEHVWVELAAMKPAPEPPFAAGLVLRFAPAAGGLYDPLHRRWGPPQLIPPSTHETLESHQFNVVGLDFDGYIILQAEPGSHDARVVILRRFSPELRREPEDAQPA